MRPYLAILKDSFREAIASRVLLVLLIVTTLALLAIVPISLTEKHRSQFQMGDFPNPPALVAAIMRQLWQGCWEVAAAWVVMTGRW